MAPYKVGPDYIDPGYHALATGRPGRNLDPVLVGEHRIAPLFLHGAAGADLAVVEGVMGLYDGRLADGHGSTAHVAGLLEAPVVLVVDCRGQSRSVAALVHGFRSFDPAIAGRRRGPQPGRQRPARGGAARGAATRSGCRCSARCRGARSWPCRPGTSAWCRRPSTAPAATAAVEALAELVAAHVDLDAVLRLAEPIPPGPAWDPAAELAAAEPVAERRRCVDARRALHARPVVAVAGGAAFTFGYAENAELLAAAGLEVAVVDPLHDERLPDGTAALVLGGGFPEVHAAALSANAPLRAAVADARRVRCSGARRVRRAALPLRRPRRRTRCAASCPRPPPMTGRLTLGYRDAVALTDSVPFAAGQRVRGHEFHHCAVTPRAGRRAGLGLARRRARGLRDGRRARVVPAHPPGRRPGGRRTLRPCRSARSSAESASRSGRAGTISLDRSSDYGPLAPISAADQPPAGVRLRAQRPRAALGPVMLGRRSAARPGNDPGPHCPVTGLRGGRRAHRPTGPDGWATSEEELPRARERVAGPRRPGPSSTSTAAGRSPAVSRR